MATINPSSAHKLTIQYDSKPTFKHEGKAIDLEKATQELSFTGKDGKTKTVKGFEGSDGLFYALKQTKDGGWHINIYGEPQKLSQQQFKVNNGEVSRARFGTERFIKDETAAPAKGSFDLKPAELASPEDFAKKFALNRRGPSLNSSAPASPSQQSSPPLVPPSASPATSNTSAATSNTSAATSNTSPATSNTSPATSNTSASSPPPDTIKSTQAEVTTSVAGYGPTSQLPAAPLAPALEVRDPRDSDLHALMDEIANAKAEMTQWLGANSALKSRIAKGLDDRLALVKEELTQRHQIIDPDAPVNDQTITILKAQRANLWIREEAQTLNMAVNQRGYASLDDLLKSTARIGDASELLDSLHYKVVMQQADQIDAAAHAQNQSSLSMRGMLSSVNRRIQDVRGDGHCQFHSFAHAAGTADFNSVDASDAERKTLLTTLASLTPDQLARIAKSDLELADTYRILRTGIGQKSVGSDGWGRREHLQLKAIQTQRPVIALTPTSAVVCQPDGTFEELKDMPAFNAARQRLGTSPEPLYIVHNGRDHWQSTEPN